jgi:DEAD/DEAH box helicase domain-containing protein
MDVPNEIYLDTETLRLSHEVAGGWSNIHAFGLAVGVTWDEQHQFREWYEPDATKLIEEAARFDRIITFNGERFDFQVLSAYGDVRVLYPRSLDLLADLTRKLGHRVKFESLVQATLGRGKTGAGTLAVTWWRTGQQERVVQYCQQDVQLLVDVVQFGRTNGYVLIPPRQVVRVNW